MILLLGHTEHIGKPLVKRLSEERVPISGFTQDKQRASLLLNGLDIDLIEADINQPQTYEAALANIDCVFLLTPASPNKQKQECDMISACQKQGVKKIVKISSLSAQIKAKSISTTCRHEYYIEETLKSSGIDYTILRPTIFSQSLLGEMIAPMLQEGNTFRLPLNAQKINLIDTNDIANVSAHCLTGEHYNNKILEITGFDTINMSELARILTKMLGRNIKFQHSSMNQFSNFLSSKYNETFLQMHTRELYQCIARGEATFYTDNVQIITGHPPLSVNVYIENNTALFNQSKLTDSQRAA